jgi:hypothetical protein
VSQLKVTVLEKLPYEVLTRKVPFAGHLEHFDYDALISGSNPELPFELDYGMNVFIVKWFSFNPTDAMKLNFLEYIDLFVSL